MDLSEIREQSAKWNLEGDARILRQLEAFGKRLQERTKDIDQQFRDLLRHTQSTQVKLGNYDDVIFVSF